MAVKQYISPTGAAIKGTLENVPVRANIVGIDADTHLPKYTGFIEPTSGNITISRDGELWPYNLIYLDENGEEWLFHELKIKEESSP